MIDGAVYIYIDESGSLSDPRDTIVTLAAIKILSPGPLRWIIKRVKRSVQRKKSKRDTPPEFEFYTTTNSARAAVLEALAQESVKIFALSVFKGAQIIPHNPENYGILPYELLRMCGAEHERVVKLIVDKPFNTPQQRAQLTAIVCDTLDLDVELCYIDSIKNPYVQLADFVAGGYSRQAHGARPGSIPVHPTTDDQRSTGEVEDTTTRVGGEQLAKAKTGTITAGDACFEALFQGPKASGGQPRR